MNKSVLRTALPHALLPVVLAGIFVSVDVIVDRWIGRTGALALSHLILGALVLSVSYLLLNRAVAIRRRAEATLMKARDDLEAQVHARTAELTQANAALRTSEETARALMNASPESAVLLDTRGIVLASNEITARRLGTTIEQMVGSSLFDLFPPEVAATRRAHLQTVLDSRQPLRFTDERAGRTFDNHVHPIRDTDGRVARLAVFGHEITERVQTEMTLRSAQLRAEAEKRRLEAVLQALPIGVIITDAQGGILLTNGMDQQIWGSRPLTRDVQDYEQYRAWWADSGKPVEPHEWASAQAVQQGKSVFGQVLEIQRFDGSRGFVLNSAVPIRDDEGRITGSAVAIQDITELRRAEQALRRSEEKYRLLFQNMTEGFALYELLYDEQGEPADWRVLEVNDAYTRHTGLARDQIVGRRLSELFPAAVPEYLPRFAAVVATQTPQEFETHAQAVGRHHHVSVFPAGGRRFAAIIEDITARKQSEEALRRAQAELAQDIRQRSALEERQRLARDLHDSVSQALYGISLGINTALTLFDTHRAKTLEALDYALSLTQAGLTEMRALIFELRPESLQLEGLVIALTKQAEAVRARHGITVELSLCDEPSVPLAAKEALYRIVQEALQNAIKHALAGRLEIRLMHEPAGLTLEVSDDGVGFDSTADYPGHLGLQSMRERALSLGGTLEIQSAPGRGTRLCAQIPVADATGAHAAPCNDLEM